MAEIIGQGASVPTGHIPFTPRAKKALELSLREALQLGHNYIGTEHVLLGLLREGTGVAADVLVGMGADLARVRQMVVQLLSGYGSGRRWNARHPVGALGRALHLRLGSGRMTLFVNDPELADLPEVDLVISADDPPGAARAYYTTVRENLRLLDQRLAELESAPIPDDDPPPGG